MFARFPLVLALAGFTALVALGCGSQHGEPCQIPGDCASGLTCCQIAVNARGVCLAPGESCTSTGTDAGPRDAGVDADTGVDAAVDVDANTTDAGTTDAGTTDAATADAGTTDAGTSDAATTDAGVDTGV
jgi:hypothetical protein